MNSELTLSNNVFLERTSTWEELKKTSEEGLFYLKHLLEVYSQADVGNFSKDDLNSLKRMACDFTDSKQEAALYLEANRTCQRVFSTGSTRREKSSSEVNNILTIYEQVVQKFQNENRSEMSEELKRLVNFMETLQEGEVVSSVFPSDEKHFTCPISQSRLVEPVKNKECLHTYSRQALLEYLKHHKTSKKQTCVRCPVAFCDKLVSLDSIEPDHEMEKLLKEWSSRLEKGTNPLGAVSVEEFVSS
ncbi:uncharacterized protein Gasu_41340 [Galdieria sulphuraria]|uniref:SP-RING-type domain-containing protein n=1 Tax=Galdieria sulphuraria TaxID=130081 RepID=M2WWR2_GALSU|nr:uncharacterized protein Gasu_41340 [Galdieria sulphuraria]EME28445.1 hypothetical protein Gasu_41340 [Galdieria sulphuraria]|eukprot:XP_005704965.1 hypothetical protein Gasu_41340 [Galdieria sulphuraria]